MKALTKYSKDINLQYIHFLKLFWRGIFGIFPMIFAYISYLLLNLFGGFTFFIFHKLWVRLQSAPIAPILNISQ